MKKYLLISSILSVLCYKNAAGAAAYVGEHPMSKEKQSIVEEVMQYHALLATILDKASHDIMKTPMVISIVTKAIEEAGPMNEMGGYLSTWLHSPKGSEFLAAHNFGKKSI
jgi:hypothetical protein